MILYFNPGHETAVHNASPFYTAPVNVVAMQQELAFLPAWYGMQNDVVLVNDANNYYYSYLSSYLLFLPKAVMRNKLYHSAGLEVSMWGISPQAVHYFEELNKEYDYCLNIPDWREEYIYFNSRQAARDCLLELVNTVSQISDSIIPHFYTALESIEELVNSSPSQFLAKAPYSSSGRGLLWLPTTGLTRTERQILHGMLKKQQCVSVEKVLDKQMDFAMEFLCDGQGNVSFAGYSLFYTNAKGAYEGNHIGSQESIINELTDRISSSLLEQVKDNLTVVLKDKYAHLYKGCIGVDMLVYKEGVEYKLHPCLEINMRYNMGYLALKLYENYISSLSEGRFSLGFSAKSGEIYKQHLQMQEQYPVQFADQRLWKGYLSLCPVNADSKYWAYVVIK